MSTPKGTLLLIGGAEDKENDRTKDLDMAFENKEFKEFEILRLMVPENSRKSQSIEVITTATDVPDKIGADYIEAFRKLGCKNIGTMNIENREQARDKKLIKRIENADVVLFSGGKQFTLSTVLGCSPVVSAIFKKYKEDPDFIVAGTSAGAMVMSKTMLYEGHKTEALIKGDVRTTSGLGFIDNCIIDTHFIKRGRIVRLTQAILVNPSCTGIGLGEDTAVMITKGNKMECFGSGMVVILDGDEVKHTNVSYAEDGYPLCVENITMHVLAKGNGFLLKEREFLPEKKVENKQKSKK